MSRELDEHDTPAEVDATFRTLRRVSVGYFTVFLVAITGVPALTLTLGWWSEGRLIGGMSPGFVMAAFGLYVFFFLLGLAAATLSTAVEARMLGGPRDLGSLPDEEAVEASLAGPDPAAVSQAATGDADSGWLQIRARDAGLGQRPGGHPDGERP